MFSRNRANGHNQTTGMFCLNQIKSNANYYSAIYRKRIRGTRAGTRPDGLC